MSAISSKGAQVIINLSETTTLNESAPNNNMGSYNRLLSGTNNDGDKYRCLLKFTTISTSIPAGSTVDSASLSLTISDGDTDVNSNFALYRMNNAWAEGLGTGASGSTALTGETTWAARLAGALPAFPLASWGTPGAQSGTDYVPTPSSTTIISGTDNYSWGSLEDDVQHWLDNPLQNQGWILISDSESSNGTFRQFISDEGTGSDVPTLTINYTPVIPEPKLYALISAIIVTLVCLKRRIR